MHSQVRYDLVWDEGDNMPDVRVDSAHVMSHNFAEAEKEPLQVLLEAIAGKSRQHTQQQSERQAHELGDLLRRQHADLAAREQALEERLAQIEEETNQVRLSLQAREQELAREIEMRRNEPVPLAADPYDIHDTRQLWQDKIRQAYADPRLPKLATSHPASASGKVALTEAIRAAEGAPSPPPFPNAGTPPVRPSSGVAQPITASPTPPVVAPPNPEAVEALEADRRSLELREQAMEQAWNMRRSHLQELQNELNEKRQQLEQFHAETQGMYQHSLEMRLVSEELWSQVLTAVPSATATGRLRGLRQQLEGFLAAAEQRLQDRRDEVQQAAQQLERQHQRLMENRQMFEQWMRDRHRQLDEQSARLADRERQLFTAVR